MLATGLLGLGSLSHTRVRTVSTDARIQDDLAITCHVDPEDVSSCVTDLAAADELAVLVHAVTYVTCTFLELHRHEVLTTQRTLEL